MSLSFSRIHTQLSCFDVYRAHTYMHTQWCVLSSMYTIAMDIFSYGISHPPHPPLPPLFLTNSMLSDARARTHILRHDSSYSTRHVREFSSRLPRVRRSVFRPPPLLLPSPPPPPRHHAVRLALRSVYISSVLTVSHVKSGSSRPK